MSALTILQQALADGLKLTMGPFQTIRVRGPDEARARWLPAIKAHKPEVLKVLTAPRRAWDVTEPTGAAWRSCVSPPMTMAELLAAYGPGTTAAPVEDPDIGEPLPLDVVEAVNRFLDALGEDDPTARREILQRARDNPAARAYYLQRARPQTPQKRTEGDQGGTP